MPSFKVPCPSCEAPVLIKNSNLVGTKVECPKCKYRFKVEEPATDAEGKKTESKEKKAKPAGKNKKLIKILAGVGAVVVLAVVAIVGFGGGNSPSSSTQNPPPRPTTSANNSGGGANDPNETKSPTPGTGDPPKPVVPSSTKNASNLLPGQAIAVYRFNMEQLRQSPAYEQLVDRQIGPMFEDSMGFPVNEVETYIHCFAGDDRVPFGVLKLNTPAKPAEILANPKLAHTLQPKPKAIKSYNLYAIRSNPFISAVSHALSMSSLFGEFYEHIPLAKPANTKEKPLGLCVYDTQHILVGDYAILERFLDELDENGYPPFKTAMIASPTMSPTPPPGTPGTPTTPAPTTPAPTTPTPTTPAPTTPAKPPATPASGDKAYTSTDTYRTVEYPLKKALDHMEADRSNIIPMLVYAERFDYKQYDPKLMKKDFNLLATLLDTLFSKTRYMSANVLSFTQRRLIGHLRMTFDSSDYARTFAKDLLNPGLEKAAEMLKLYLTTPVEFRDYSSGSNPSETGIPPSPYGGEGPMGGPPRPGLPPGGGFPPKGGSSGGPPGGMMPTPTGPGKYGSGSMGGPPRPGGFPGSGSPQRPGSYPNSGTPPRPGGYPNPGGYPTPGSPQRPGGYPGPGGFGPPMPGGPGGQFGPEDQQELPQTESESHVDLGLVDDQLDIAFDLSWTDTIYRQTVAPRLAAFTNQIKGKMTIFSMEFSWHAIAAAGPRAEKTLKTFPRGTAERRSDQARYGLPYPPDTRVSFFADLLPFLGRESLSREIDRKRAWFDVEYEKVDERTPNRKPRVLVDNLTPAGEWVPELLVPYYPQSAWRATSSYAPDHVLGATNYVGVAGVGLNIARVDPNSPEFKKKVGITGYNWGSKPEEITDGLSNTIYLIQTPPGLQQPWIAGGGATLRGFDETDPMAGYRYTHPNQAKQGTYALMADGSVRWIPTDIDPKVLNAMATRAGGESLADIDKVAPKVEPPKRATTELKAEPKVPFEPKKPDDKKPEDKKADDKQPKDKKQADPKAADPKTTDPKADPKKPADKTEPAPKAEAVPAPKEKK